eukprot:jgi/Galph1/1865/GphlegSOOS_G545.1
MTCQLVNFFSVFVFCMMWKDLLFKTNHRRKNSLPVSHEQQHSKEKLNTSCKQNEGYKVERSEVQQMAGSLAVSSNQAETVCHSVSVPDIRLFTEWQKQQDTFSGCDRENASESEQERFSEIIEGVSESEDFTSSLESETGLECFDVEAEYLPEGELLFWGEAEEDLSSSGHLASNHETFKEKNILEKTESQGFVAEPEKSQRIHSSNWTAGTILWVGTSHLDAEYIRILLRRFQEIGWRDEVALTKTVLSATDARKIIKETIAIVSTEPTVVDVGVPEGGLVRVIGKNEIATLSFLSLKPALWEIGDIHGHLYDLSTILEKTGYPSKQNTLVFNGDYVDRGSWGVEVLLILCLLKLLEPRHAILLRGNHETSYCNVIYGFRRECLQKYNIKVYLSCQQLFSNLPVAAVINNSASLRESTSCIQSSPAKESTNDKEKANGTTEVSFLREKLATSYVSTKNISKRRNKNVAFKPPLATSVELAFTSFTSSKKTLQEDALCGSLPDTSPTNSSIFSEDNDLVASRSTFRYLTVPQENEKRVLVVHGGLFRNSSGKLGTLKELGQVQRTVIDPVGTLEDVLWSDPDYIYGFGPNRNRGAGIAFGPDITKQFLRSNHISYIIRSHEGPDAREKRKDFPGLIEGHSIDFVTIGKQKMENSQEDVGSSSECHSVETRPILITVFSAPCYPEGPNARNNRGAICTLDENMEPTFEIFPAVPRPSKQQATTLLLEDIPRQLRTAQLERSSIGRIFLKLSGRNNQ